MADPLRVAADKADFSTDTTTFTAPLPGEVLQPGDVILYTVTTTSLTATTMTPVSSSGVLLASQVGTTDACQSQGWYFVVGPSVPASLDVNLAAARQGTLAWYAFRNVDNTTPLDVAVGQTNQNSTSTSAPVMPSITTVTPGALIVGGLCHGSGSTTVSAFPSGWSQVVDGTRRNGLLFQKGVQAAAGATGTGIFTLSASQQNRMWVAALRPSDVTPPEPPIEATLTTEPYPGFSGDIADGASIVYDASNPADSVVITTNKDIGGGLYVYNLSGEILSSSLLGAANSVDWRDTSGLSGWDDRILVMTSDRQISALRFYWLNRTTKALTPAGTAALGWEPYGTCLYVHSNGQVYAFVTQRGPDDTSPRDWYQYPLSRSGENVTMGAAARTVNTSSVVEGLAADDITGYLYASEEDVGLFRYSASPTGGSARTTVDLVGAGNLVADVEDVAVSRIGGVAKLLVSSQGDSSYHVYDAATFTHEKRFTIVRPGGTNPVTSTDGLDMVLEDFGGAFPNGLIVVHDGDQTPVSDFAFVDAGEVFGTLPHTARGSSVADIQVTAQGTGRKSSRGSSVVGVSVTSQGAGHKVARGSSVAVVGTATTGAGRKASKGSSVAVSAVSVLGEGYKSGRGASVADIEVLAQGAGHAVASGRGSSVAQVEVSSLGQGYKVARGASVATIGVSAQGSGRPVQAGRGASVAEVEVSPQGVGHKIARGSSIALIGVSAQGHGRNPAAQIPVVDELTLRGSGIVLTLTRKTVEMTLEKV